MKFSAVFLLGLVAIPMISMASSSYSVQCTGAACQPFTPANSYVLQLAVSSAQQHQAVVGDHSSVFYIPGATSRCEEVDMDFTVNRAPVLNSTNLTYVQSICMVKDPTK